MAQNKNCRNSNGVIFCPVRTSIYRISDDPKPRIPNTKNGAKMNQAQNKPARLIQQPSFIKRISNEFESAFAMSSARGKKKFAEKMNRDCPERETVTVYGQDNTHKAEKSVPRTELAEAEKVPSRAQTAKAMSKKGDGSVQNDDHEGKFSDYISKVKKRMMRTVSTIGGARGNTVKDVHSL